jgi:16S rRNA processing protein RimM
VAEVIVTGANDVWVVRGGRWGEVLVPIIDEVVHDIDESSGTASVRLLPGLLPEPGGSESAGE